jgi:hypothetical protein
MILEYDCRGMTLGSASIHANHCCCKDEIGSKDYVSLSMSIQNDLFSSLVSPHDSWTLIRYLSDAQNIHPSVNSALHLFLCKYHDVPLKNCTNDMPLRWVSDEC